MNNEKEYTIAQLMKNECIPKMISPPANEQRNKQREISATRPMIDAQEKIDKVHRKNIKKLENEI
jgi:hypothetical protein